MKIGKFPTPVGEFKKLGDKLNIRLHVKFEGESDLFGSGNKTRKMQLLGNYALGKNIKNIICEGGSFSNTCASLATYQQIFGYTAHLVLYGDLVETPQIQIMRSSGAEVYHIGEWNEDKINQRTREIKESLESSIVMPAGLSSPITLQAGTELFEEAQSQLSFDYLVIANGTGGTVAGMADFSNVIAVSIAHSAEYFAKHVAKIANKEPCLTFFDGALEGGYCQVSKELQKSINIAQSCGLRVDPIYTGKAFHGLVKVVGSIIPEGSKVLLVHTGGINCDE